MSESDNPTSGDDDWGGPEETPWQRPQPPQTPGQPGQPQPPEQPPQHGSTPPPPYGQQPPQYGAPPPHAGGQYGGSQYGGGQYAGPPAHQPGQKLPNYLVHNIVTTVLCCPPAGIVGIVFAAQVNGKLAAGDHAGAKKASDTARMWFIISLVAAVVGWAFYFIVVTAANARAT